jgi:hypothetical protein
MVSDSIATGLHAKCPLPQLLLMLNILIILAWYPGGEKHLIHKEVNEG